MAYHIIKNFNSEPGKFDGKSQKREKPVKIALIHPEVKYPFPLVFKEELTHDTRRFRFALPSTEHSLGLPVGQHIYLSARINGELIERPYAPISTDDDKGYFDLVLKVNKVSVNPLKEEKGKMSLYLHGLQLGETVDVRGSTGRLQYKGNGVFEIREDENTPPIVKKVKRIGMIAGGTGITPMYQLIKHICNHPEDETKIQLLFSNKNENDILFREDLEKFKVNSNGKFDVWYTIDKSVEKDWPYDTGFVNKDMIAKHLPAPGEDVLVLMCGSPSMINFGCIPNLEKLGFTKEMRFAY